MRRNHLVVGCRSASDPRFEAQQRALSEVVTFQRHFIAGPGEFILETVVMDRNGGKIGARRTKFEIPKMPDDPSLSDLALVRRIDPFHPDGDPEVPLRYSNPKR